MVNVTVRPGFVVSDLTFTPVYSPAAAQARVPPGSDANRKDWRLIVGKADAGAMPAIKLTCSFKPSGAPPGTQYALRQIAFHKYQSSYYRGHGEENGSVLMGTTTINQTWNIDCAADIDVNHIAVPTLPYFSSKPVAVANGARGEITMSDSPGGAARMVRANLLTGKRNLLRTNGSATDFLTFLVAVPSAGPNIAIWGMGWSFSTEAKVYWEDLSPTLTTNVGRCQGTGMIDPKTLDPARLKLVTDVAMLASDTIAYKVNNGFFLTDGRETVAPITPTSTDTERRFTAAGYEIIHSRKLLLTD